MTQAVPHVFAIFDQYATDPNKELTGAWVTIGPALRTKVVDGVEVPDPDSAPQLLIARSNNKRYSRMLVAEYEANKAILDMKDDFAEATNERIMTEIAAKSILLGWKNLHWKAGEPPLADGWDITVAKQLLSVKDFREMVGRHSANQEHYKMVQEAEAAKN